MLMLDTHLLEELLEGHLSLRHQQHVLHHHLILLQVHVPDLTQTQLRQNPVHMQTLHQLLPVPVLQRLRLQLDHQHVHLRISTGTGLGSIPAH